MNKWAISTEVKQTYLRIYQIPLTGICPRGMSAYTHWKFISMFISMLIARFSIIALKLEMIQMFINRMDKYIVPYFYNIILSSNQKNELLLCETIWMKLIDIILNKSQTQRNIYYMIAFLYAFQEQGTGKA